MKWLGGYTGDLMVSVTVTVVVANLLTILQILVEGWPGDAPGIWASLIVFGPSFFAVLAMLPVTPIVTYIVDKWLDRGVPHLIVRTTVTTLALVLTVTLVWYLFEPFDWVRVALPVVIGGGGYGTLKGYGARRRATT